LSDVLYWFFLILVNPLVRLLCPCRVLGWERFPEKGPLMVCANHTSILDPVLLFIYFGPKKRMYYMAKREVFKHKLPAFILSGVGVFPVSRGENDVGAVKTALRHLKNGERVMLFPEGKRVTAKESVEAKLGAVRLAMKLKAPILPLFITPGRKLFRRTKVIIGKPFLQDPPADRNFEPLLRELMDKIYSLEGQA
jgi:1-acyl-sn-glycerol-3-phosphate acyltransferase